MNEAKRFVVASRAVAMKNEKSCGAVVFTRDGGRIKYVIVETKNGCFGFPKGHVEKGESEIETAVREILEETGLCVDLKDGFREESFYTFTWGGEEISKHVVYFLAEFSRQSVKVQESELNSVRLMSYDDAIKTLQFADIKSILTKANEFIMK